MFKKLLPLAIALLFVGCDQASKSESTATDSASTALSTAATQNFKALPKNAPMLTNEATTAAKVELGKMLFFDPRLSASQLISCNTCHNLALGGADLQETSIGHGWQKGPRNAPTALNSAFHIAQFWDGRSPDLIDQAKGPVQAGVEMNNTPAVVEETLRSMPGYITAFQKAFGNDGQVVTFDNMAVAIATFESTLSTPSPFDAYLKGDHEALDQTAKDGLKLFMDKGCASCHNGVGIGGGMYAKFGTVKAPSDTVRPIGDLGRSKVTNDKDDDYVFRVPTLRNIAITGPYFHSGKVHSLSEAVEIMADVQLDTKLQPAETKAIVAFLGSLTGTLPKITYPVLPAATEITPQPMTK
ncbi:MAG: cytochrome-c peroxidase [SAR324 cluster bacterium]|nr:cytochrome-c peroxidase [SAR324 cluster bacterium]